VDVLPSLSRLKDKGIGHTSSTDIIEDALNYPKGRVTVKMSKRSILNVKVYQLQETIKYICFKLDEKSLPGLSMEAVIGSRFIIPVMM